MRRPSTSTMNLPNLPAGIRTKSLPLANLQADVNCGDPGYIRNHKDAQYCASYSTIRHHVRQLDRCRAGQPFSQSPDETCIFRCHQGIWHAGRL